MGQYTYAPINAVWNYHDYGTPNRERTIKVIHDTLINGNSLKTLEETTFTWPSMLNDTIFNVEQFGKVLFRNDSVFFFEGSSYPNYEEYLFSFDLQIGDTIHVESYFPGYDLISVVDTLYNVVVSGQTVKQWEFKKYCEGIYFGNATLLEGVGLIDDFFFWEKNYCSDFSSRSPFNFQCYESSSLSLNPPCNPISLSLVELEMNSKKLLKVCDYLGRETKVKNNTPLIFYYSNGTIERKYIVD